MEGTKTWLRIAGSVGGMIAVISREDVIFLVSVLITLLNLYLQYLEGKNE
jgi:hypothetical protein